MPGSGQKLVIWGQISNPPVIWERSEYDTVVHMNLFLTGILDSSKSKRHFLNYKFYNKNSGENEDW
jgi:hypothetical protein